MSVLVVLLSLPSFVTPQLKEFFRLDRGLTTTLPTRKGGVVHLFGCLWYQRVEEDAEKLRLTDRLLQAVLVEAQMVCVGQPVLVAGDFNVDPPVIPCLSKVFLLDGMLIWLLLILSVLVLLLMLLAGLVGRMAQVRVGIFLLTVPVLLLLLKLAMSLIDGSLLTFLLLLAFELMLGWLMLPARLLVSPFGLLVG